LHLAVNLQRLRIFAKQMLGGEINICNHPYFLTETLKGTDLVSLLNLRPPKWYQIVDFKPYDKHPYHLMYGRGGPPPPPPPPRHARRDGK